MVKIVRNNCTIYPVANACHHMMIFLIPYHFKLDYQKVDQLTGGKGLIRGTKHHKDNQLQSLERPCIVSSQRFLTWHK